MMVLIFHSSSTKNRSVNSVNALIRTTILILCFFCSSFVVFSSSWASEIRSLEFSKQHISSQLYYLNPARELQLLKKILLFERSWKSRADRELRIGILYNKSSSISSLAMEDWLNLVNNLDANECQLDGIPLSLKEIELEPLSLLEIELNKNRIQLLYISPMETKNDARILAEIARICRKLRIGTFSAVPEYLDSGVAVGFELKNIKPTISINLDAARAQGLDFSSQFLRLVKKTEKK
uniref:YfiR family protein n=1 Tax=Candidatus Saccharicenans sp. TaxID=2819258 RepID=UPI004049DDCD